MEGNSNQQSVTGGPKSTGVCAHMIPPAPMGYPLKDSQPDAVAFCIETRIKGDGFWKGCCAGLCCCCALDMCL